MEKYVYSLLNKRRYINSLSIKQNCYFIPNKSAYLFWVWFINHPDSKLHLYIDYSKCINQTCFALFLPVLRVAAPTIL